MRMAAATPLDATIAQMLPGVALLMALAAPPSRDAGEPVPSAARLEVRSGARCLTRDDITRRVLARTSRVRFSDDASITISVAVAVQRQSGTVVAELTLGSRGGSAAPRRIVARSCAEAADAVALILAVTLDPTAQRTPAGDTTKPSSSGSASDGPAAAEPPGIADERSGAVVPNPPGPAAVRPVVAATPAAREPPPPVEPPDTPIALPPAPLGPPARRDEKGPPHLIGTGGQLGATATTLEFGAALEGEMVAGAAPRVMPGLSVSVMLASSADRMWAPAMFAGWSRVWRSGLAEGAGSASFTLDIGRLGACPLRLRWARLVVRPCASVLVGRMSARGETAQASASARPFSAAGLMVDARLGGTIALVARLGAGVTLVRDRYAFGDDVFYRAEALTTSASLGLGFHWP